MDTSSLRNNQDLIFKGIILLVLLWVVYLFLKKIRLIPSAEDIKADKNASLLKESDFFKPTFYKTKFIEYGNTILKNKSESYKKQWLRKKFPHFFDKSFIDFGRRIWDSKGFFKDNESGAIAVMREFKNKIEVSLFSEWFSKTYNRDLVTFFDSYMSNAEQSIIFDTIDKLPLL